MPNPQKASGKAPSQRNLQEGPVIGHLLRLALPMIIAFIFATSYTFIDRWFVSRLGDVATAAIGMAFAVQLIIISIGAGIGTGINSFIARNLGGGFKDEARDTARHAFVLAIVLGLVIAVVGLLGQRALFRLMGAEGELLDLVLGYMTVIFLFTPINLLGMFSSSIFQGYGNTMTPMRLMMLGNILNLILDPILIFGFGPIPAMGIEGAALATVIGRTAAFTYIAWQIFVRREPVHVNFTNFVFKRDTVAGIMQVGLPSSAGQVLTSVAMVIVFGILTPFGQDAKSAYTIVFTFEMVVFLPVIGVSQAITIMTGHNFGAKLIDRVNRIYSTGILVALGFMCVPALLFVIFPWFFAGIFAQGESVLNISANALRIVAVGSIFYSIPICTVAGFQGLGLGNQYLWATVVRIFLVQLPVIYAGALLGGLNGVWYSMVVANIANAFVLFFWYRHIFKRKIVSGEVEPLKRRTP